MQSAHRQIVLLDDDRAVRESLTFLLKIAGYAVRDFASADAFYRHCDLDAVKGLILDHHMPQVTGLDLARRLRADGWRFPILLVTAAPSSDIIRQAAELGISNVLEKPISDADMMAFIEALA